MLGNGVEQLLLLEPFPREEAVCVSVGAVAQNGDDSVARTHLFCNLLRSGYIEGTGSSKVQTFFVQAAVNHVDAVSVGNVDRVVEQVDIGLQVVGDAALANSLCDTAALSLTQLAAGLDVAVKNTAWGIGNDALDAAVADGLEVSRDAGNGTSSTAGASKGIDVTTSLIPDLGAGGLDVGAAIGDVVELISPDSVVEALGVAASLVVVVLWVLKGDGRHGVDFGTEQSQEVNLALRLSVGHVDDQLVAPVATHVGKTDTSVASSALDDSTSRLQ